MSIRKAVTIRAYIKRSFLNLLWNIVVLFVALQILGFCVQLWPQVFAAAPWVYWVAALALWLVMAWFAIKLVRIPCPRCSNPLGVVGLAAVIGIRTIDRCPHCRVSLDEPDQAKNAD